MNQQAKLLTDVAEWAKREHRYALALALLQGSNEIDRLELALLAAKRPKPPECTCENCEFWDREVVARYGRKGNEHRCNLIRTEPSTSFLRNMRQEVPTWPCTVASDSCCHFCPAPKDPS